MAKEIFQRSSVTISSSDNGLEIVVYEAPDFHPDDRAIVLTLVAYGETLSSTCNCSVLIRDKDGGLQGNYKQSFAVTSSNAALIDKTEQLVLCRGEKLCVVPSGVGATDTFVVTLNVLETGEGAGEGIYFLRSQGTFRKWTQFFALTYQEVLDGISFRVCCYKAPYFYVVKDPYVQSATLYPVFYRFDPSPGLGTPLQPVTVPATNNIRYHKTYLTDNGAIIISCSKLATNYFDHLSAFIIYSTDGGVTWNTKDLFTYTQPTNQGGYGARDFWSIGSRFFCVWENGATKGIYYSDDLSVWTKVSDSQFTKQFVVGGVSTPFLGSFFWFSGLGSQVFPEGTIAGSPNQLSDGYLVKKDNKLICFLAFNVSNALHYQMATSTDGLTWTILEEGIRPEIRAITTAPGTGGGYWADIAYNEQIYVIAKDDGGIYSTSNGVNLTPRLLPVSAATDGSVAYGNGYFAASHATSNSSKIYLSSTGY